jgi:GntR family transcriptional regulator
LAADLSHRIQKGEFRQGERLPSEPQLAAEHHIGRPTVRQATDILVRKGLIERRRGSGTYVRKLEPQVDLFSLDGTIAAFKKSGFSLKTKLLKRAVLRLIDDKDSPLVGQSAFQISRLGSLEQQPVLLEHIAFRADVFPGFDQIPLKDQSISELVERIYHRLPCGSRQEFTLGTLEQSWAQVLQISSKTPLLLIKRTLDFPGAPAACHSSMYCRADRIQFVQNLTAISEMGVNGLC